MRAWTGLRAALLLGVAGATFDPAARAAEVLPPAVGAALRQAGVPAHALTAVVLEATGGKPVLQWQPTRPVNPASLFKLATTQAALERLGPAWTWSTAVSASGSLQAGVLEGNVHIRGSGDPKLTIERVWLLLRRLQQAGVRDIRGDILLDGSAFAPSEGHAADFDGDALRPYNVRPAALLFNQRSVVYSFVPDVAAGVAHVHAEPPLHGTVVDASVRLTGGACDDWRAALKASFEPGRARFAGGYAAACGESSWPVADPQPATFEARLVHQLWRELGGQLGGSVREGPLPADARPLFEFRSPALAEVVRDINKFSNNVMAQQLFLTLALSERPRQPATPESAREFLTRWLVERTGALAPGEELVVDNGSGLSRTTRVSAERLARLLLLSWEGPWMSELMASLPISGLDGTLRRARTASGRAHLKTGSLRDVAAVGGYVLSNGGRRYVVVAIVNHPLAGAARPALDALVLWALRDAAAP